MIVQLKENMVGRSGAGKSQSSSVSRMPDDSSECACVEPYPEGIHVPVRCGTSRSGAPKKDSGMDGVDRAVLDKNNGHGSDMVALRMIGKVNKEYMVMNVLKNMHIKEISKLVAEKIGVKEEEILISSVEGMGLRPKQTAGEVVVEHGEELRVVKRDKVGVDNMEVSSEPRQKKKKRPHVELYNTHRFDINLGFESPVELLQTCKSDTITADVPRHLTIRDKGEVKFSKHPRRMLMVAITKYLEIEKEEMMPIISVWSDEKGTEVNIETKSDAHSTKLLGAESIYGVGIVVTPHKFRNLSRAKVWDNEGLFSNISEEDLTKGLAGHAVVGVKRQEYVDKTTKMKTPGKSYLISFNKRVPPSALKFPQVGVQMKTELFVPRPAQCFHCQRFGHYQDNCNRIDEGKVCYRCSEVHEIIRDVKCEKEAKCVNCFGNHPVSFAGCPAYRQEYNIKKIAVEKRIAPREVLRKMKEDGQYVDYARTLAQAVNERQSDVSNKDRPQGVEESVQQIKEMVLALTMGQGLGNQLKEAELTGAQKENAELISHNRRLQEEVVELASLRAEMEEMRTEMKNLRKATAEEHQKLVIEQRGELDKVKEQLQLVREENSKLKEGKETKDVDTVEMEDDLVKANKKVMDLEEQLRSKNAELAHAKTRIDKTTPPKKSDLEKEIVRLKKGIKDASSATQKKVNELTHDLTSAKLQFKEDHDGEIAAKDEVIGKLNDELNRLRRNTEGNYREQDSRHGRSRSAQRGICDISIPPPTSTTSDAWNGSFTQ